MHFEKKLRRLEEEIIDLQVFRGDSRRKIKIEEIQGVSRSCGNPDLGNLGLISLTCSNSTDTQKQV